MPHAAGEPQGVMEMQPWQAGLDDSTEQFERLHGVEEERTSNSPAAALRMRRNADGGMISRQFRAIRRMRFFLPSTSVNGGQEAPITGCERWRM